METSVYETPPLPDAAIQLGNWFFGHYESHWYEDRFALFTVAGDPGDPNYWIETVGSPTYERTAAMGAFMAFPLVPPPPPDPAPIPEPSSLPLVILALVILAASHTPRILRKLLEKRMNRKQSEQP